MIVVGVVFKRMIPVHETGVARVVTGIVQRPLVGITGKTAVD